jgi:hypothetical protein
MSEMFETATSMSYPSHRHTYSPRKGEPKGSSFLVQKKWLMTSVKLQSEVAENKSE